MCRQGAELPAKELVPAGLASDQAHSLRCWCELKRVEDTYVAYVQIAIYAVDSNARAHSLI